MAVILSLEDVVEAARRLLGVRVVSRLGGRCTAGQITETEAYDGVHDRACHAYRGRRIPSIEPMYGPPGTAYVYRCYGVHPMLNVSIGPPGVPTCVLIRAIRPTEGWATMLKRRKLPADLSMDDRRAVARVCGGPGKLTMALGIDLSLNGHSLWLDPLLLEPGTVAADRDVCTGPRVGIDGAGEPAVSRPWRFRWMTDETA